MFCTSALDLCFPSTVPFLSHSARRGNNERFRHTASGIEFSFVEAAVVDHVVPTIGAAGDRVKVVGKNFLFSSPRFCRFGTISVPASFVNSTMLLCNVPIPPEGISEVNLTFGEADINERYDAKNSLHFTFRNEVRVSSIEPRIVMCSGETTIRVEGSGFSNTTVCVFGTIRSIGAASADGKDLICNIPLAETQKDQISFSLECQGNSSCGATFHLPCHQNPKILSVAPDTVSPLGSTELLVNVQEAIQPSASVFCAVGNSTFVEAKRLDSRKILCTAPPLPAPMQTIQALSNQGLCCAGKSSPRGEVPPFHGIHF